MGTGVASPPWPPVKKDAQEGEEELFFSSEFAGFAFVYFLFMTLSPRPAALGASARDEKWSSLTAD